MLVGLYVGFATVGKRLHHEKFVTVVKQLL